MAKDILQDAVLLSIGLTNILVALFVLLQNPRAIINRAFFAFVSGVGLWISGLGLLFITHAFVFNQLIFYGGALVFGGLTVFAAVFPRGQRLPRRFWAIFIPLAASVALVPFNLFVSGMTVLPNHRIAPVNGPLMLPYALVMCGYVAISVLFLARNFRQADGVARIQMRWLFSGIIIFMAAVILTDAILPALGWSGLNLVGPAGSIIFAACATYAIGLERVELYEKIRRHSEELEEKVRERTAQLRQAREEERQVMADISHGLQTPLTIVRGELDLLKEKFPVADGTLDMLTKSIDGISKFIYDFLKLARFEAPQTAFKKEPVNFSQLLQELVEYFDVLGRAKDVAIVGEIEPDITVSGEREKLEELVTNLVSNAFKYIGEGHGKKIAIALRRVPDGVELCVEDNGAGIDAEDLPNIFNRFYRSKARGRRSVEGTGLGLAICKTIADKHGAAISVESVPGKGTLFRVLFPLSGPVAQKNT